MIFGFNTDAAHEDTVYHVQSEAREKDLLLQTQVFVKGRCIGKISASYASSFPTITEVELKETLKTQHRLLLDAVRKGEIESLLAAGEEIRDVDGQGLALKWLNPEHAVDHEKLKIKVHVSDHGKPVRGARLTAHLHSANQESIPMQAETGEDGNAELELNTAADSGGEIPLMVRAEADGKAATRKFRLRMKAR